MDFLTKGYNQNPKQIIKSAIFKENCSQMVIVKDIEVYSLCEHHMLPFFGKAHIAYEPSDHVVGFGALTRLLEHCTQRLNLQEDAGAMAARLLQERLNAKAVCVVIDARHPCHNIIHTRGHDARAITWSHAGDDDAARRLEVILRQELLHPSS